ncbi:MAG: hypothetical protein FD133_1107 [Erysipelotrichaceae bacterium]|nr:MAG: hypothetical protein FD179_1531 [Erysipelotrichaceae bacterium]TXT18027.1 MAG: hypothetical protein FD133_1107 [Erysipelotrichaceae bacterium]
MLNGKLMGLNRLCEAGVNLAESSLSGVEVL